MGVELRTFHAGACKEMSCRCSQNYKCEYKRYQVDALSTSGTQVRPHQALRKEGLACSNVDDDRHTVSSVPFARGLSKDASLFKSVPYVRLMTS